jgi:hypothetical protein
MTEALWLEAERKFQLDFEVSALVSAGSDSTWPEAVGEACLEVFKDLIENEQ